MAVRAKRGGGGGGGDEGSGDHSAWPVKRAAEIPGGDLVIGGLHMVHEREEALTCGPVMPQGGLQGGSSIEENSGFSFGLPNRLDSMKDPNRVTMRFSHINHETSLEHLASEGSNGN